ncbi:MAG TPA: crosslink repair DNA glycosylase YcaQ family protein [Anaeromyxobacteraceae bacterium]|nr:crosslink repair DNA glycosylase YcaQ family protein [Anaeromyxobacteraceae bacterium]
MRPRLQLSARHARALHLAAQGLLAPPRKRATREDVRGAIARMELLQLDTIHVVARSPHLVLFSRLGPYEPRWLEELLESGRLFECWAHEACLAPIEDYALHRRYLETRDHWFMNRARRLFREEGDAMGALLAHVAEHGPVKAADFKAPRPARSGWWTWKKEKALLEAWFALGELMVARRVNFHRVYDLRRRVYPAADSLELPSAAAAQRAFVERAVRALGVTQPRWIHDYFRTRPRLGLTELEPLLQDGTLVLADVEGWKAPGVVHRDHLPQAERLAAGERGATHTALLSPFDPVVWDRERVATLFGFDYRLECYLPAPKRRYGYYVLPILRRGALVGRLDAKAHRAEGIFEVKALYLEPAVRPSDALLRDVAGAVASCARWHGTPAVRLGATVPASARAALAAAVRASVRSRLPRAG